MNIAPEELQWKTEKEFTSEEGNLISATFSFFHGQHTAFVKWDGCIEYDNASGASIHICELDDHIEMMMKLRDFAKDRFGKGWPE